MKAIALLLPLFLLTIPPSFALDSAALQQAFCPFKKEKARALLGKEVFHHMSMADVEEAFARPAEYYGPCRKVTGKEKFVFEYENASLPFEGRFTKDGKIEQFYFTRPDFKNDSFEKIAEFSRRHLGNFSLTVRSGDKDIVSLNQRPLNISTNSILFLLKALQDRINRKELSLDSIARLDLATKSVSDGYLHHWQLGTSLTLDTLKSLMVAEKDMTAADMLILAVGKPEIEKSGIKPFLTNREYAQLFQMGAIPDDPARLTKMINELPLPKKPVAYPTEQYGKVNKLGWFTTTGQLCSAIMELKGDRVLFGTMRDMNQNSEWVGWKEFSLLAARSWGIAQNTALIQKKAGGEWFCVSLTVNQAEPIDEQAFTDVSNRILSLISKN